MRNHATVSLLAAWALLAQGCDAFAEPAPGDSTLPPSSPRPGVPRPESPSFAGSGGSEATFPGDPFPPRPLDDRPAVVSEVAPPPIEGGTLLVLAAEQTAVVSDPDRDRVQVVALDGSRLDEIALRAGDRPGRAVESVEGRVHVLLGGAGELADIAVGDAALLERRPLCATARGIAYDASTGLLHVACADGRLLSLPAAGGEVTRSVELERDLRDVVVRQGQLHVSTFKRAELLTLDAAGGVVARTRPDTLEGPFTGLPIAEPRPQTMRPAVAWRTFHGPEGSLAMVHQRAQLDEIELAQHASGEAETGALPAGLSGGSGAYGGGTGCDAIVQSGVTFVDADGGVRSLPPLVTATLPVDAALSHDGDWLAIAVAGGSDEGLIASLLAGEAPGAVVISTREELPADQCIVPGLGAAGAVLPAGQGIGVAWDGGGRLVVHSREPHVLRVYDDFDGCLDTHCPPAAEIALGGAPRRDTGHELFHIDAGAGLACASCHPGGGDDGVTWTFSGLGPRRTQLFNMGIAGTEPLHWDGDMADLEALMGDVFVERMGGRPQTAERVGVLATWLETLRPLPPLRAVDDPAAQRGEALFTSAEVGCSGCHGGAKLTNNETVDVGTGGAFQVPSLIGVAYHRPFLHTGCADSLRERFDPACGGGDAHGTTSHLSDAEIDDLVAYLETL